METEPTKTIDVSDLPEAMAKALAEQAEHLRTRFGKRNGHAAGAWREPRSLPGHVIGGDLTREMIYAEDDE